VTLEQAIAAFRNFNERLYVREVKNAIRRAGNKGRREALERLSSRGLGRVLANLHGGRKIFTQRHGKTATGVPPLIVNLSRVRVQGQAGGRTFETGLKASGMAALIEQGGRTRPHTIQARRGVKLYAGGRPVRHPGSRVPRNPFLDAGGRVAEMSLGRELEDGIVRAAREAGIIG
jgi:hypothetical protein